MDNSKHSTSSGRYQPSKFHLSRRGNLATEPTSASSYFQIFGFKQRASAAAAVFLSLSKRGSLNATDVSASSSICLCSQQRVRTLFSDGRWDNLYQGPRTRVFDIGFIVPKEIAAVPSPVTANR